MAKIEDKWIRVPHYKADLQNNCYNCGPSSMQMALSELDISKDEKTFPN